jgi:hypothetical protein
MEEDAHVQCEGQRAPAGVKRKVKLEIVGLKKSFY